MPPPPEQPRLHFLAHAALMREVERLLLLDEVEVARRAPNLLLELIQ